MPANGRRRRAIPASPGGMLGFVPQQAICPDPNAVMMAAERHQRSVYASNGWEVDLARRELRSKGTPVPLGSRAFEILAELVQASGELVSKDELTRRVWRDVH